MWPNTLSCETGADYNTGSRLGRKGQAGLAMPSEELPDRRSETGQQVAAVEDFILAERFRIFARPVSGYGNGLRVGYPDFPAAEVEPHGRSRRHILRRIVGRSDFHYQVGGLFRVTCGNFCRVSGCKPGHIRRAYGVRVGFQPIAVVVSDCAVVVGVGIVAESRAKSAGYDPVFLPWWRHLLGQYSLHQLVPKPVIGQY